MSHKTDNRALPPTPCLPPWSPKIGDEFNIPQEINFIILVCHMYHDIFISDILWSIASDVPFDGAVNQIYCQPAPEEYSRWLVHVILVSYTPLFLGSYAYP